MGATAEEEAVFAKLSRDLSVAGRPLEPPRILATGWRKGQHFRAQADPDRALQPWAEPDFLQLKDPVAQRKKTTVQDLAIDRVSGATQDSFARVVHGVLDEEHCAALIAAVNHKGFTPALVNVGRGDQVFMPEVRDCHRVIVDSATLSKWLLEVLRPHLPERLQGSVLVDLNERCRFLCYTPGQYFAPHSDGCYTRPPHHKNSGDASKVTVQLYLHQIPASNGGATTFLDDDEEGVQSCQPNAGDVLVFTQDLYHEGSLVAGGLKYTVRTEAMYRTCSQTPYGYR